MPLVQLKRSKSLRDSGFFYYSQMEAIVLLVSLFGGRDVITI